MPRFPLPSRDVPLARLLSHVQTPLFGSAYALILSSAATSGLGIVYWTVAARFYDPVAVGLNATAISTMTFISYIAQLNMAGVLIRFIPSSTSQLVRKLVGRGYLAAGLTSALAGLVFIALFVHSAGLGAFASDPTIELSFVGATIAWSLFAVQDGVLTGLRRTVWVPIENSVFGISKIVLLLVFVDGLAKVGIFASWVIPAVILVLPVNWLIFRRFIPTHRPPRQAADPPPDAQGLLRYAAGDYLGTLFYAAAFGLMPLVVATISGPERAAYFFIAWTIASVMYVTSLSMATSLTVQGSAELGGLPHDARRILGLVLRLQAVGLASCSSARHSFSASSTRRTPRRQTSSSACSHSRQSPTARTRSTWPLSVFGATWRGRSSSRRRSRSLPWGWRSCSLVRWESLAQESPG